MRLRRAVSAWAVAVSSLALFATGASAFAHPNPTGRCNVGIQVVPRHITAGEQVTIFGRLVCRRPARAADQIVRLYHELRGVPGFTLVASTRTDANGFYEFQNADAPVETSRIWHVRAHRAESANKGVRVAPQVTLEGPPEGTQIMTGPANKVTFTGKMTPADAGARVLLERQNAVSGSEWRRIDLGVVQPNGTFSITHTFIVPGDASLRVIVRSQRRNLPAESNLLSYEISQAQNSALTIESSVNPIAYGGSTVISGTLAGGVSQAVTLLARTSLQPSFTAVAQATTDTGGKYSFPAQVPTSSTYYEVQGGGKTSAALFEGVRDLLTAAVSASSVQDGQTVTFSGSVAPVHPNHIIYLQRQNASGSGFHMVRVAVLSAQSTFTIPYQVFGVGAEVFRVYIPGGPDNEGGASQPFTIGVTPAPAAALKSETPGNSSLPTEGSGSEKGSEGSESGAPSGH